MNNKNIAVIDGDSIIYLSCINTKDSTTQKTAKDVLDCVDLYINNILKACETNTYTGFLTEGSFRYNVKARLPYKGNRKDLVKPKFFNIAKYYLIDEYKFIVNANTEADDLCITANKEIIETNAILEDIIYNPIICTIDKDLKQIPGTFYNYKKNEIENINEEKADFLFYKQLLTGDTSDNILGIEGIGEVKATKILENSKDYSKTVLEQYTNKYGYYEGIKYYLETYDLIKLKDDYKIDIIFYEREIDNDLNF